MQVVTLIHDENGVYGASFPDFPGCTTVADSADRVIVKAAEALAFHAEGKWRRMVWRCRARALTRRIASRSHVPRGRRRGDHRACILHAAEYMLITSLQNH